MSALAMILTAAMAVPGDAPEKVSGEMVQQGLDLSGEWEGVWHDVSGAKQEIEITSFEGWGAVDEGAGRVRFRDKSLSAYGIYEQRGDRLMICVALLGKPRPDKLQAGDGVQLFVLRRIKSKK